jgi:hypothetical protein
MFLLQAEVAAIANTGIGFREWDLVTWGIIVLGLVFLWRIMPMLIKKESKNVVEKEVQGLSKESFNCLIKENESIISETNSIVNKMLDRFSKVEEDLILAKKEREYFNSTTIERLGVMTGKISELRDDMNTMKKRMDAQYNYIKEAALKSNLAIVWNDNAPLLEFFDAVFMVLYLGGNGNTIDRVTGRIVKTTQNLEIYKSALSKFRKEHPNTNAYFESAIKQIHREWH